MEQQLQNQLGTLGWAVGQQSQFPNVCGRVTPLRQLATANLREQTPAAFPPNQGPVKRKSQSDGFSKHKKQKFA